MEILFLAFRLFIRGGHFVGWGWGCGRVIQMTVICQRMVILFQLCTGMIDITPTFHLIPNTSHLEHMMTSSNGNIFPVTGPLCGEFTGLR